MIAADKETPGLRDRIALLIRRNAMHGVSPEATAAAIMELLDWEAAERCRDADCARVFPHSRLSAHLWKHAAEPPFDRVLFAWLCFSCGLRRGHRIHKAKSVSKGA